jgi:hypothetical protein
MGGPDSWVFCNMRRAAAGLMITGLILSLIACAYFGALGLKQSSAKAAGIIAGTITFLAGKKFRTKISVIFYIVAMCLMIYLKGIIEFNSLRTGIMAPGAMLPSPGMMMGPMPLLIYYGASLIITIIAWVLGIVVAILMMIHGNSFGKKVEDEPVIHYKEYSEVKE